MKVTFPLETLLTALNASSKLKRKNAILPVEGWHFSIKQAGMSAIISATDLTNRFMLALDCFGDEEFDFILDPARLKFLTKLEKTGDVEFEVVKTLRDKKNPEEQDTYTYHLHITQLKDKVKQQSENPADYPVLMTMHSTAPYLTTASTTLLPALKHLRPYTNNDPIRPMMSGVCVRPEVGSYRLCATDAHRLFNLLVTEPNEYTQPLERKEWMVLANELADLMQTFTDAEDFIFTSCLSTSAVDLYNVELERAKKEGRDLPVYPRPDYIKIDFKHKGFKCMIVSRALDGTAPDYDAVVPHNNPIHFGFNKSALVKALDKAVLFANKTTGQVIFEFTKDKVALSSHDVDFETEYESELAGTMTNQVEDLRISFNANLLTDCLKSKLIPENFTVEMSTPVRAMKICFEDGFMILMPLMIN